MMSASLGDSYAVVENIVCLQVFYSSASMKTLRLLWVLHPWRIFVKYCCQREVRGRSGLTFLAGHFLMVSPSRAKDEDWHGNFNL